MTNFRDVEFSGTRSSVPTPAYAARFPHPSNLIRIAESTAISLNNLHLKLQAHTVCIDLGHVRFEMINRSAFLASQFSSFVDISLIYLPSQLNADPGPSKTPTGQFPPVTPNSEIEKRVDLVKLQWADMTMTSNT